MTEEFLIGALRFFPFGILFIIGMHWLLHRYESDAHDSSERETNVSRGYQRLWYVLLSIVVVVLSVSAALNLALSGRDVLVAGVVETTVLMIWTAGLCVLLFTPWGDWFARQAQNWGAFRYRFARLQKPMLILGAFAQLGGLFAVLVGLWSALHRPA